jgi:hypothetical protein
MSDLVNRMIRAAKLDVHLYEEVEADTGAMGQAMTVVVLSSVAAGIGSISAGGIRGVVVGTIMALIGWYIWACLTYFIGTKIHPEPQTKADLGELLRTIGFSSSPGPDSRIGFHSRSGEPANVCSLDLDAGCDGRRRQAGPRLQEHMARGRSVRDWLGDPNGDSCGGLLYPDSCRPLANIGVSGSCQQGNPALVSCPRSVSHKHLHLENHIQHCGNLCFACFYWEPSVGGARTAPTMYA